MQVGAISEYVEDVPTRIELVDSVEPDSADVLCDVRVVPEERHGGLTEV